MRPPRDNPAVRARLNRQLQDLLAGALNSRKIRPDALAERFRRTLNPCRRSMTINEVADFLSVLGYELRLSLVQAGGETAARLPVLTLEAAQELVDNAIIRDAAGEGVDGIPIEQEVCPQVAEPGRVHDALLNARAIEWNEGHPLGYKLRIVPYEPLAVMNVQVGGQEPPTASQAEENDRRVHD